MTMIEYADAAEALKTLAKAKEPEVYLVNRNDGWYVYILPPKRRALAAVVGPEGACWEGDVLEVKKAVAGLAEAEMTAFSWNAL